MASKIPNNQKSHLELLHAIQLAASDTVLLDKFLADILTPQEYREIKKRWQIITQLHAGMTQREIAYNLHIGIGTVTRGSRVIQNKRGGSREVLALIKK